MRNKIRLEKRENVSTLRVVLTSVVFTLLAFVFCGFIIAAVGFSPLEVYGKMLNKVFLSSKGIRKMINASLPLLFCGLGVALTFKMNLNNIGAEGQYAMGAIFGGAFVLYGPEIGGPVGRLILALCCFLGGAVFCLFCDLIARTVFAPTELSISSVTAVFGAPVVIYVMINRKRG